MYLWKYWREARWVFLGYLGLIVAGLLWGTVHVEQTNGHMVASQFGGIFLLLDLLLLAVLSVYFGGLGMGRSLGEGAGAFLLTRPQRRASFVWQDWGMGVAMVTAAVVATNLWSGYWLYRAVQADHSFNKLGDQLTMPRLVALNTLSLTLICALIFSVVYLGTVLLKKERGNLLGIAAIVGYLILSGILKHYEVAHLPSLLLNPYAMVQSGDRQIPGIAHSLWISALLRAGVVLLFPLAAQLRLERTEIAR